MPELVTTLGPMGLDELGAILPHEHVFVDLRTWDQPGYGEAEAADVVRLMGPELARARAAGVTAIVEPSTVGVGRRVDILLAVSRATGFPLVAPTGVYREPWLPPWVQDAREEELRDWMIGELSGEIEGTGVQAGWIKVGASDEALTAAEAKVLRAAAGASAATGAAIGSHTVRGVVARAQVDLLEATGAAPERFVWIHAHQEPDIALHHELGRRGVWLEYDGIGEPGSDDRFIDLVRRGLDAGLGERILLSHDRGWYDPAQPGGGTPRPFTYLTECFLPTLAAAGIDDATIDRLTRRNPFAAFARKLRG
ncbi:MAG: esterase [Chloroflexia bacterium]|nr:esterase [Chloroflexia bacterium]